MDNIVRIGGRMFQDPRSTAECTRFSKEGNRLVYQFDCEEMWIEPWGDHSLRIRSCKMAQMPMEDWALLPRVGDQADISIDTDHGTAEIVNGNITAKFTASGKMSIYNQHGKLLIEEYVRHRSEEKGSISSSLRLDARQFRPILGGDYEITMRFESLDDQEKLFGMGQYQQSNLDLKGTDLELAHRNSQASVPFVLSSLGYGFLWNNPAVGRVVFGKNMTTWQAVSTKILDYWVTAGDTPAQIEESYANVTGKAPMMPDYAMGFWQCKLRYQTQDELLEIAREYKRRNLPISVIVIDYFHWPLQGDWRFDPTYWPDPDAMIKELQEMGIELMISIWPTVDYRSENFQEMKQKGYLIRTDRGYRVGLDCQGNTIHYDATNPAARDYVWQKAKQNYYDKGVRIFWLDEAEPEYTFYDFDNYRYHLGPNVQIGNLYPMMYAQTFYDGMQAEGQENIVNLLRCAWAGSQRYGALVWSGDINSDFKTLRDQYAAGLQMGIAGIPWWTTDIGGFHGGWNDDPGFQELLVRWFEYGTFCPVMRLHGNRKPQEPQLGTTGGATCLSGAPNEVWTYGEENEKIFTNYLWMREALRPYVTELMQEAHEKGSPVMRPLFYEFPADKQAWEDNQSYLFGANVLVAPVMYEGMRQREVYLPQGANWVDVWTKQMYVGGQTITVDAPLQQIPLFVKEGTMSELLEYVQ